jgi:hypothetical protein
VLPSTIGFQIQPHSGIMERVEIISSQKKKLKRYFGLAYEDTTISKVKVIMTIKVRVKNTSSADFGNEIILMSSKNNA